MPAVKNLPKQQIIRVLSHLTRSQMGIYHCRLDFSVAHQFLDSRLVDAIRTMSFHFLFTAGIFCSWLFCRTAGLKRHIYEDVIAKIMGKQKAVHGR